MKVNDGFACPCCRYMTICQRNFYEICEVCGWEDDGDHDPKQISGPNHITLRQGQTNFALFGACDEASRVRVLKDGPELYERADEQQ